MIKGIAISTMAVSACALLARAEAPTSFYCDFNNGIPANIKLVDNDGNEPSADVATYGFAIGTPWIDVRTDESHVRCAASTSWYKTPAQSDDWMILPKVSIVSADVTLSWEARAHDNVLSDGYNVYVSDSGDNISDLKKLEPIFSCPSEKSEWTQHTVSLAEYSGKEITVAFVNNSNDKALLYVDNIIINEKKALVISKFVPTLLPVGEPLTLSGTIKNNTDVDMKGIDIVFSIDNREFVNNNPSTVIPAHQSVSVSLNTDFVSDAMKSYSYTLTASSDKYSVTEEETLLSIRKNVLMEEGTGTWCMWCPRGIVAIENLKRKYPETFIPVAVHSGKGDPMVVEGYSVYTTSGYPVCVANRMDQLRGDPKNMEDYYLEAAAKNPMAALVTTGEIDSSERKIILNTEVVFSKDYTDAQFAVQHIIAENNVHSEDPHYSQKNAYSGGDEAMGGFENLPNPVPASQMWYQDVARMITGDESGIEGSLPTYIAAGKLEHHACELVLDDNITNLNEIKVISAIIDTKSGEVVNCAYSKVSGLSSIKEIEATENIRIYRRDNSLQFISDNEIEQIALISINGILMKENTHNDSMDITGMRNGIYIIRVKTCGKYYYFKQAL